MRGDQAAERAEFEDIEYAREGQAERVALPQRVAQREDGAREAAVGNELERGGGGGITDGPHLAERFEDRADAGEGGSALAPARISRVPPVAAGTEPSTGACTYDAPSWLDSAAASAGAIVLVFTTMLPGRREGTARSRTCTQAGPSKSARRTTSALATASPGPRTVWIESAIRPDRVQPVTSHPRLANRVAMAVPIRPRPRTAMLRDGVGSVTARTPG